MVDGFAVAGLGGERREDAKDIEIRVGPGSRGEEQTRIMRGCGLRSPEAEDASGAEPRMRMLSSLSRGVATPTRARRLASRQHVPVALGSRVRLRLRLDAKSCAKLAMLKGIEVLMIFSGDS